MDRYNNWIETRIKQGIRNKSNKIEEYRWN